MRKLGVIVLGVLVFGAVYPLPAQAYNDRFTTGQDWIEKMSAREKFISLFVPMMLFRRYGVTFHRSPEKYISTMDSVLLNNPYLESEDVANIFASAVYAHEPESRPALEAMEREFRMRREGVDESYFPPLSIRPVLRQDLVVQD